ncbi:uncharacterized protein LOC134820456 isoform X2 [Bolinopsis microptera]|uniref:uncharacterized protein LOC134820456 isoform X2 n=1 Tax=Bolinopsis microptera TaxID=2820187 RepID=UPI003079587A
MQGISRQHGREGEKPSKRLTFQVSEGAPSRHVTHSNPGFRSRLSQSTPNLMDKDGHGLSTKKLQSGLKKLTGRWKGSQTDNKMESAYSETNISAIPHYDLEFPSSSEQLISTVHEEFNSQQEKNHVKRIYDDWKDLRRGVKYQVPEEFSLFWVVLGISPNKRFKIKLYFDPDRRQVYISWDTQVGCITYFDGIRTYKIECMTTIERQDIWSMTVTREKTLQISCNFEPVAQWKLISDQNLLCVQPIRFGGKYFLTARDGLPPRPLQNSNSRLRQGISMVELDRSSSNNTTDSVASSEEYSLHLSDTQFASYDEATIKFNSMHDLKDHYHSSVPTSSHNGNNHKTAVTPSDLNKIRILNSDDLPVNNIHDLPQTNTYQIQNSNHFNNNSNQPPSIYKDTSLQRLENRVRSGSGENTQEMTKVKQLSNDLVSLISQLESDFRENENSFKQKIKTLDVLSRNMVQTLKTMQRESRDSKADMKRREADQMNSTIALEDRITGIEDVLNGSEYNSMADGFTDVIQQFMETDGFRTPSRPKNTLPNFKKQMEDFTTEVNEKIKSLNKRMKIDQSSMVKEINFIKTTVEQFGERTQTILLELESGVNSCAEENRHLNTKLADAAQGNEDNFTRVQDQLNAFDLKLNSLDGAIEELEEKQQLLEAVPAEVHYTTVDDLSDVAHFGSGGEGKRRVSGLPAIQEENRLEDLEKTCRDLMEQMNLQNKQIELLREENFAFRSQLRGDLGLSSPVKEDAVPTENMTIEGQKDSEEEDLLSNTLELSTTDPSVSRH